MSVLVASPRTSYYRPGILFPANVNNLLTDRANGGLGFPKTVDIELIQTDSSRGGNSLTDQEVMLSRRDGYCLGHRDYVCVNLYKHSLPGATKKTFGCPSSLYSYALHFYCKY